MVAKLLHTFNIESNFCFLQEINNRIGNKHKMSTLKVELRAGNILFV